MTCGPNFRGAELYTVIMLRCCIRSKGWRLFVDALQKVRTIRRAYRQQLNDAISQINNHHTVRTIHVFINDGCMHGTAVERSSLTGELSLSCARPTQLTGDPNRPTRRGAFRN